MMGEPWKDAQGCYGDEPAGGRMMARNLVTGECVGRDGHIHSSGIFVLAPDGSTDGLAVRGSVDFFRSAAGLEELDESGSCESDETAGVGWRIRDSGSEVLYELHTDMDAHVTVKCHCAQCRTQRTRIDLLRTVMAQDLIDRAE